jgi:YVTN family beta-propeller protein
MKIIRPLVLSLIAGLSLIACMQKTIAPSTQQISSPLRQQATTSTASVFVINGGDASISVLDAQGTQVLNTLNLPKQSFPHHAYFSPNRQVLAISLPGMDFSGGHGGGHGGMAMPGRFALLDANTGQIKTVKDTPAMHHNAVFSPDGREIWAAAMESNGRVLVYDAENLALLKEIPVGSKPAEVTFSSDGLRAFVANGSSQSVTAIDRVNKRVLATIPVGKNPVGAWIGSDNRMYVDNEESETISVINANTLTLEETVPLGFMPGMAALAPNQKDLWISDAENGKVILFTRSQPSMPLVRVGELVTGVGAHAIAFSTDGKLAFVTNQEARTVSVIDVIAFSKVRDLKVGFKPNGLAIR